MKCTDPESKATGFNPLTINRDLRDGLDDRTSVFLVSSPPSRITLFRNLSVESSRLIIDTLEPV